MWLCQAFILKLNIEDGKTYIMYLLSYRAMCAYRSYLFTLRIWFLSLSPFFIVSAILSFVPTGKTILILPILKQKIQTLTDIASSSTTSLSVSFSKTNALKTLPASDFLPLFVFLGLLEGRFDLLTSTVTAYIRSSLACALSECAYSFQCAAPQKHPGTKLLAWVSSLFITVWLLFFGNAIPLWTVVI